jgi:O-antigen ligase
VAAPIDPLTLALYAVIITYVWRWQDLFPILGKVKLPVLALLAILGLYILDQDARRSLGRAVHPITKAAVALLALAVLSVPGSLYPGLSFRFILNDLSKNIAVLVVLAASIRTMADVRRFLSMLLIGGGVYALYVYFKVPVGADGRLGGLVYYDANDLGMLMVSCIPIALFYVLRGRSALIRIGATLLVGLFTLSIVHSGSRGAFLGLIAIGIYITIAWKSAPRTRRIGSVLAVVAALLVFGGDKYWGMMGTLLHPESDYNWSGQAESGRMELWKRGIGYMLANPILGVGARCFPVAEGVISPLAGRQEYGIGLKWSAAHNAYVQVGAELGIPGLIMLLTLVGQAFKTARRADDGRSPGMPMTRAEKDVQVLGDGLACSVVGFAVTAFFLSQGYAVFFLVLCGIIVGFGKVAGQRVEPPPHLSRKRPRMTRTSLASEPIR